MALVALPISVESFRGAGLRDARTVITRVGASLLMLGAVPIGGRPAVPVAPWTCTAHVQPLQAAGSAMHANGFQSCAGEPSWRLQRIELAIQRKRFFGWETIATNDSGLVGENPVERTVFYDCRKSGGVYTFRALIIGHSSNNAYASNTTYSINQLRINCDKGYGVPVQ